MLFAFRKLLIGRVTKRLHVEVRKVYTDIVAHTHTHTHTLTLSLSLSQEDNRLHVPVGTRLYKLEAVELTQDSAS